MLKNPLFSPAHPGAPRRTFHQAAFTHRSDSQRTATGKRAVQTARGWVGGNATPRIFTRCGLADGLFEHPARGFSRWAQVLTIEAYASLDKLYGDAGRELPGPERTAIEMDELLARINPDSTILQLQCGIPKFPYLDTGNIEIECLPLDM